MNKDIIKKSDKAITATYTRPSIVIEKGQGCTLWDTEGRAYTDFLAGIAVCNLGHAHPEIAKALCNQAHTLFHVSNLYYTIPQTELASWLTEHSFADRVFFCNSGAEANEAAIKIARRYFYEKGEFHRYRIVTAEKSFHGRTMATLSATGQDKIKKGFSPILEGFDYVPFNNIEALKNAMEPSVCAVMLEPVQGEGGVILPDPEYLETVRRMCDETGTLLIFDEIQTGIGRTGKLFAYEHFNIEPDIMTLAKALGNGLPIGAMLTREYIAQAFTPGAHASTFGGTPVITAAALKTLEVLTRENIIDYCRETGVYFKEKLMELKSRHESVVDVRGIGLLIGMELNMEGAQIVLECMKKGFLINCIQGNILRFAPPLIIKKEDIDALINCLDEIL
ncbi:Acetylornithine aminotransferase [Desulfonema limicola]|uniref:Acetylornithine aminotransferase n=1 Tax=Desulfonema limicola TaxID=45656 RepID=A0A975GGH8_9BACT|nr:acetylornithine transaminase [Desulfonema limicola]QTA80278.1 Acetylornithine aminotransferase [Desulfonema limicola]